MPGEMFTLTTSAHSAGEFNEEAAFLWNITLCELNCYKLIGFQATPTSEDIIVNK
jgi:hypothetical protein